MDHAGRDDDEQDTETESTPSPRKKVGFAAMDPKKVSEIASRGGRAAHRKGTAHRFKKGSALARESGRKGGYASHAKREAEEAKK